MNGSTSPRLRRCVRVLGGLSASASLLLLMLLVLTGADPASVNAAPGDTTVRVSGNPYVLTVWAVEDGVPRSARSYTLGFGPPGKLEIGDLEVERDGEPLIFAAGVSGRGGEKPPPLPVEKPGFGGRPEPFGGLAWDGKRGAFVAADAEVLTFWYFDEGAPVRAVTTWIESTEIEAAVIESVESVLLLHPAPDTKSGDSPSPEEVVIVEEVIVEPARFHDDLRTETFHPAPEGVKMDLPPVFVDPGAPPPVAAPPLRPARAYRKCRLRRPPAPCPLPPPEGVEPAESCGGGASCG